MAEFPADISLTSLNGLNGFRLAGVAPFSFAGRVSSAGDVNGDGIDDIMVGSPGIDDNKGATYVLFGKNTGFAANIDLGALSGGDGFRISGAAAGGRCGASISSAGDVNGDGLDDLVVGTCGSKTYVVFGRSDGFAADVTVGALSGSAGFRLSLPFSGGLAVSSAGDVNGDGLADMVIGANSLHTRC